MALIPTSGIRLFNGVVYQLLGKLVLNIDSDSKYSFELYNDNSNN
jgi:hypothetical protein